MHFIHSDPATATNALLACLQHELEAEKPVLWLVPGGSNISISCKVMQGIPERLSEYLTVMLTDERYGKPGHPDSNEQQLRTAGFQTKKASFIPVLDGEALESTVETYARNAQSQFASHQTIIGQFGIGADGHIAGILPDSLAAGEKHRYAAGYHTPSFTRITLTFPALRRLSMAYALVYGDSKHQVLQQLRATKLPLAMQPAQILKAIPQAFVYNDQLE